MSANRDSTKFHQITCHDVGVTHKPVSWFTLTITKFKSAILTFCLLFLSGIPSTNAGMESQTVAIRIGVTPVILDQKNNILKEWKTYIETHLKQPVVIVQSDSYGKITTQLLKGELDFGWICGYPYIQHHTLLDLIASPLYNGKPLYQSYLIVSNSDTSTSSLLDLKNSVFAYSDPDSNSGYLYAQYSLLKSNKNPKSFFKKTFFTWQHKNTVEAVAVGLAQAGIVDSYIWETMNKQQHPLIAKTRIAHKSELFGFPPLVASRKTPNRLKIKFQKILLAMSKNDRGRQILQQFNLDGFVAGNKNRYDDILKMHLYIESRNNVAS